MARRTLDNVKENDFVIVERLGRPWRLTRVEAHDDRIVTVRGGFTYCAATGARLDAAAGRQVASERLTVPSQDALDYLTIVAFHKRLAHYQIHTLPKAKRRPLAELSREFSRLLGLDLGEAISLELAEYSD
ncbi:hypothetical protein [Deinococcus peraridilitoris]|uniref:Uncharacterized protein n=1 Tax=Deinococcus peraridilitoris (strain DSM 19664 / LMG 22246 / CIP 109416 / KR-200) TaxID=937777 RepID=L0A3A5_DEIPD|nr:hypothetical protein [Deinococcus peraridilitoris]AFZ67924.1 hypothetical protein Deipe_2452 [Deinococcus peraridilitoris DSM 19664]